MKLCANAVIFFLLIFLLNARMTHAGLLTTDAAEPVVAGQIEAELNGAYIFDKAEQGGVTAKCHSTETDLTVTAGVVRNLDISVGLPYTITAREKLEGEPESHVEGFNDMNIDLKLLIMKSSGFKMAIKPGVIIPLGESSSGLSDGRFGFTAALLTSKEFAEGAFLLHANAGYARHNYQDSAVRDASRSDIYYFSVAGEAEIASGLTLGLDTGLATNSDNSNNTPPAYALGGITYAAGELFDIYAGIKVSLTEPEDDLTALLGAKLKF